MKILLSTLLLTLTQVSFAQLVVKAKCDQGTIVYDSTSKDYMIAATRDLIYGDEGRTTVYSDTNFLFHVKNKDFYFRPPTSPDGGVHLPWAYNTVEIKVDKRTGEGFILEVIEEKEKREDLTNCK